MSYRKTGNIVFHTNEVPLWQECFFSKGWGGFQCKFTDKAGKVLTAKILKPEICKVI